MLHYTSHKTTAAQNEVTLSCHKVRGLYFLPVVFVSSIYIVKFVLPESLVSLLIYNLLFWLSMIPAAIDEI